MAYTLTINLALGAGRAGLADLRAQLLDTDAADVGAEISTGFAEIGGGNYLWTSAAIPDGHRGGVKFYRAADVGTILASASINPQETENADIKTSEVDAPTAAEIDTQLSGTHGAGLWGSAGSGAHTVTLTLLDQDDLPVEGVLVTLWNEAETLRLAGPETTDADGQVVFNRDDGVYQVLVTTTAGFETLAAQELTVSGATSETYVLTRRTATPPAMAGLCTVQFWLRNLGLQEVTGRTVSAVPSAPGAAVDGALIVNATWADVSDVDGYAELQLPWEDQFTRGDGQIIVKVQGWGEAAISIPSGADSVNFEDLL